MQFITLTRKARKVPVPVGLVRCGKTRLRTQLALLGLVLTGDGSEAVCEWWFNEPSPTAR